MAEAGTIGRFKACVHTLREFGYEVNATSDYFEVYHPCGNNYHFESVKEMEAFCEGIEAELYRAEQEDSGDI